VAIAKCIVWIEQRLQQLSPVDSLMEDFVALGTILITYSLTELINGYGFLAVFIAGIVVQKSYNNPEKRLSQLEFTERIEKLMEVGTILLLGSLLRIEPIMRFGGEALLVAFLLFVVIRPVGAWLSTVGDHSHLSRRLLYGWFGIRGIGSVYYLSYAFSKGLSGEIGEQIAWLTYLTIVLSVIVHGISATPLMNWYERQIRRRRAAL
jgi:sodium/hydrogen antiporter